jgi:hypothetical protein
MKFIGRRLFVFLCAASLLLCIAISILWVRSYFRWDAADRLEIGSKLGLRSARGIIAFEHSQSSRWRRRCNVWLTHTYVPPGPWTLSDGMKPDRFSIENSRDAAFANESMRFMTPDDEDEIAFWDREWWNGESAFEFGGLAFYRSVPHPWPREFNLPPKPAYAGCWQIDTPYWIWVLMAALLPMNWCWHAIVLARRRRANRCIACGYDLRATVDRCPECGRMCG